MENILEKKESIKPAFQKNNQLIILSSDNNYAFYLGVCIRSIVENINPDFNYDIVILEDDISDWNKELIKNFGNEVKNVSIRFLNMLSLKETYKSLFFIRGQFSIATYYRFFVPEIFVNYKRALYLDCDLVVCSDISPLFKKKFNGKLILATPDVQVINDVSRKQPVEGWNLNFSEYLTNILQIKNPVKYFQAGVMILDVENLRKQQMTSKCLSKLREVKHPIYVDQDILNSVFYGQVGFLDLKWNYVYHIQKVDYLKGNIPEDLYLQVSLARENNPCILHLTGKQKPWINPNKIFAHLWWKYARMTPFYEQIIYQNTSFLRSENLNQEKNLCVLKKSKFKYWKYRILSKIMFGKYRKKYKEKYKKYVKK